MGKGHQDQVFYLFPYSLYNGFRNFSWYETDWRSVFTANARRDEPDTEGRCGEGGEKTSWASKPEKRKEAGKEDADVCPGFVY